jgi:hypothetical protein
VFFFLNLDNLCIAHDVFCTNGDDTKLTINEQDRIKCTKDFAVSNNYVACLNDSDVSVYSFSQNGA